MTSELTDARVYVVDDDPDVRNALRWLFDSVDLRVQDFPSVEAFLDAYDGKGPGCLILDVRMPGIDGLEFLKRLGEHQIWVPVIVITGHGDVPMAVKALKLGAVDFVQKPVNHQQLLELVRATLGEDRALREEFGDPGAVARSFKSLTPKEREVLERLIKGKSNKAIAFDLDVSVRTVEAHRARIMDKTRAGSLASLVRMALLFRRVP
jgi:FixJ family two-component response regulator